MCQTTVLEGLYLGAGGGAPGIFCTWVSRRPRRRLCYDCNHGKRDVPAVWRVGRVCVQHGPDMVTVHSSPAPRMLCVPTRLVKTCICLPMFHPTSPAHHTSPHPSIFPSLPRPPSPCIPQPPTSPLLLVFVQVWMVMGGVFACLY